MNNNKIDWFSINMEAFQQMYDEYVAAVAMHDAAVVQARACEEGTCKHERRLKKDGTPDRRYECPQGSHWMDEECSTGQNLNYTHHAAFFEAIGLGVKANV